MYFANFNKVNIDVNGDGISDTLVNLTSNVKISDTLIDNTTYYNKIEVGDGERPDQLSQRLYGSPWYHWTFFILNSNIKNIWNDWPMDTSQLREYCGNKYNNIAAMTDETLTNKFIVGETITGLISGAVGVVKEVHVNNYYIVIEQVSTINFSVNGESILGTDSTDSVIATGISSRMNAPKYHIDDSTGEMVAKRTAGTSPFTFFNYEESVNDVNRNLKVIKPELIMAVAAEFKAEISK